MPVDYSTVVQLAGVQILQTLISPYRPLKAVQVLGESENMNFRNPRPGVRPKSAAMGGILESMRVFSSLPDGRLSARWGGPLSA